MKRNYFKIVVHALLIALIGVLAVDRTAHLLFSSPMENGAYFIAKMALYAIFSVVFLSAFNLKKKEFLKVAIAGIVVASMWGIYYNILPFVFNYTPFGLPLRYLSFLGMGLFGTGVAFGVVHTLAFIAGYYLAVLIFRIFRY